MSKKQNLEISQEQLQYYSRIEGVIESDDFFESEEDSNVFVQNVVKQILDDELLRVFSSKTASKIIENVLQKFSVPSGIYRELTQAVCEGFLALSTNRCASHVVQTWLTNTLNPACQQEWQSEVKSTSVPQESFASNSMELLCSTVKSNIHTYLCDQYASHVFRTLLQLVSGVTLCEQVNRSKYSHEYRKSMMHKGIEYSRGRHNVIQDVRPISPLFLKLLKRLARSVMKLDQFSDLLTHSNACPVLQILLVALVEKLPKKGLKFCHRIIDIAGIEKDTGSSTDEASIPVLFTDPVGSHLMEVLIEVCSAGVHQTIYGSCFRHHVMLFALHPVANYALQQLIATSETAQISMIVDELDLEKVLFCGHMGVVVKAVEACKECPSKQATILKGLLKAFHADSHPKDCAPLFISLVTREVYFKPDSDQDDEQLALTAKADYPCSLHGALIMQALLQYENPKKVTNSFLSIPTDRLMSLACDPSGSHIVDAFLSSRNVTLKKKNKLIKKFMGYFVKLSKEKHGSRVVDCCWKHTELKDKQLIANELLKGEKELADNYYGKFVLRNCNIEYYKKKGDLVEGSFNSKEKVKKMFSDIVDKPTKPQPQRAHKKRKSSTRYDAQTTDHSEELKALGFVAKKKKLFDDDTTDDELN